MSLPQKIWIVDDEPDVRAIFRRALAGPEFQVTTCNDGLEALELLRTDSPALVVLDVDMPRLDGWATLRALREHGYTRPVLMITQVNDVDSRVRGLEGGADDYLGKPCAPREFLARVRALLRRSPRPKAPASLLRCGEVTVDLEKKTAARAGVPVRLSRTDFALLRLLHEHAGTPVSRDLIVSRVWEDKAGASHALDTHLWRLRKKLGDVAGEGQWIQNVPGLGYVMELPRPSAPD